MHASLRRQLLHLATNLAELVENPSDVPHGFDRLNRSHTTPAADAARAALRADPAIAPLVAERCWGGVGAQVELLALPAESLGHRSATWFTNSGGQPLPEPVLAPGTDGDDTWLHQRVRRTHDVWHVVSGCPPSPAGEAALSGINVCSCAGPAAPCCLALLAQRWKEGWQRPLAEWREQLGIAALVARNRDGNGKVLA